MDIVIRLATTINAYEDVAFTSKSTNMGTYVYEKLDAIPEEFRPRLMDELSDVGLVNCWYIAGLLYKVKFQEREAGGALDISSDLEDYQERLDATVEQAAVSGRIFRWTIRRRRRLRRRRGGQGRQGQARSRARRVRGGGPGVRGEGGERPGRSVRQQVPEGLLPVAQRRRRVVRSSGAKEARLRGEVPAAVLSHQRHRGEVRQGPRDGGGRGPAARLPEPPYLEADMPPAMRYPSRRTPGAVLKGRGGQSPSSRYPVRHVGGLPQAAGTRSVRGRGWRDGGRGDEFLTFILFRRYDAPPVE